MKRLGLQVLSATAATGLAGTATVVVVFFGVVSTISTTENPTTSPASCLTTIDAGAQPTTLDADQIKNARTIAGVAAQRGLPGRAVVIALATAMQESGLRNLNFGDRDSLGLFQQRPVSGWGPPSEIMDPATSAGKFYDALVKVAGWQRMPLTVAAQTVQRSAFPNAYAKWESMASALATSFGVSAESLSVCTTLADTTLPSGPVGAMVAAALQQQGDPYVWGATGPDAFDCSGLVVYAWRQAGYLLTVRTAAQMYRVSTPVASGQEQPGDLLFGSFTRFGPGHMMIVVQPGMAVQAPRTGDVVRTTPYKPGAWKIGRLKPSVLERLGSQA